jgi:hypothetical protein
VTDSSTSPLTGLQQDFLREFARTPSTFFLTGGAVLAGWVLHHRRTDDLDLFTVDDAAMAGADRLVRAIAAALGASVEVIQTAPDHRRYAVRRELEMLVVDFVRERVPQLHPKVVRDGITMDPAAEIVANKICALLGRAEVRDLVDLYCLDGAGFGVEAHLAEARLKDAGVTPAALAWVLSQMVIPDQLPGEIDAATLRAFVGALEARLRRAALPE